MGRKQTEAGTLDAIERPQAGTARTIYLGNKPILDSVLGCQGKVWLSLHQVAVIRLAVRPGHIEPRV